ncbi:MAG: hypothetical protein ABW185_15290 [Sedimenticola sp.]
MNRSLYAHSSIPAAVRPEKVSTIIRRREIGWLKSTRVDLCLRYE